MANIATAINVIIRFFMLTSLESWFLEAAVEATVLALIDGGIGLANCFATANYKARICFPHLDSTVAVF